MKIKQTTKTFTIEGVTDENYYTALLGYPPTIITNDQVVKTFANHPITLKTSIKYHKEYDRDTGTGNPCVTRKKMTMQKTFPGNPKSKMQMRLKKHRAICRKWESGLC